MVKSYEPKCFVISEIGKPASAERARADRFLAIIESALQLVQERSGRRIEADRLDYDLTVKWYFPEAVHRILSHELVIAVLNDHNPNVNIELGIALAGARRLIILVEGSEDALPSDLRGCACVRCDLGAPEPAIADLATVAVELLAADEPVLAFEKYNALGKLGHAVHYLNTFKELSFDEWSQFLWDADQFITIATTNLKHMCDPHLPQFYSRSALERRRESGDKSRGGENRSLLQILIQRAAAEGVRVRLMVMDLDNPYLEHLIHARDADDRRRRLENVRRESQANLGVIADYITRASPNQQSLRDFLESEYPDYRFQPLRDGGSFEIVLLKRGPLRSRITLSERGAIVTPYFLNEGRNSDGPAFQIANVKVFSERRDEKRDNNFYKKIAEDLDELYALNVPDAVAPDGRGNGAVKLTTDQCRALMFGRTG